MDRKFRMIVPIQISPKLWREKESIGWPPQRQSNKVLEVVSKTPSAVLLRRRGRSLQLPPRALHLAFLRPLLGFIGMSISLLFLAFALGGCAQGVNAGDDVVIPNLTFECDEFQVPKCDPSDSLGKTAYLGLILNEVDCYTYLSDIPAGHFKQFFDASSTTTVDSFDSTSAGTFTNYKSNGGATLLSLKNGVYFACAFIDINNNMKVDLFEPVSATNIDIGVAKPLKITDWVQF